MTPSPAMPPHAVTPAPEEQAFRFRTGDAARSLEEFAHVLPKIPREDVEYHRDHYQYWLKDVVGDAALARRAAQYGKSGMDTEELRRTLVDLARERLDALANGGARKTPRRKTPAKKAAKKTTAKKPAVKKKGRKL